MRWLLWHPESECFIEEHDPEKLDNLFMQGCEDVTGMGEYESKFRASEELNMEFKLTQHQMNHEDFFREMVRRQIFSSCVNCIDFNSKDPKASCLKYKATPPPEVIVFSCGAGWEGDLPF